MTAKSKKHKWLGETLNQRYRIEALIASGGMSDVYRAVDTQLEKAAPTGCQVALKILKPDMLNQDGTLDVLARETAKTQRLTHPNIIRVQDLQQDGDTCFMVMELLEGEPLTRMIQRSRPNGLKWQGVRDIIEQILAALKYAHAHNVVHADLKPSNIFFTRSGQIKLLDFGVSRVLSDPLQDDFLSTARDETSVYGYTPAYSLPELAGEEQPSSKGDVYALACICYELLSSQHPFNRQSLSKEERQAIRLRKPGNMPRKVWLNLKQQLLGNQEKLSIEKFEQALKPVPWQTMGQTLVTIGALSAGALAWQSSLAESDKARLEVEQLTQQREKIQALNDLPPARLLEEIQKLPTIEQAGLLKLHQESLVNHYLNRINQSLNPNTDNGLPNILQALEETQRALTIYPRDAELLRIQSRIKGRQLALQEAIAKEIDASLVQGSYLKPSDSKALMQLAESLEYLGGKLTIPSKNAVNRYLEQVRGAFDAFDAQQQAQLLTIGNRFFAQAPETASQRQNLEKLREAARALALYEESRETDSPTAFPTEAALIFYAKKFSHWYESIEKAKSKSQLDDVYNDIQVLKKQLPEHFEELASVEKRLAESYLSMADALLARNQVSRAQPLLKRATALMR